MAHRPTNRCNLVAPPDPKTPIDPTQKKHPKIKYSPPPSPSTTTTSSRKPYHHHHPDPDPTVASSTIKSISKHFSKLYTSHPNRVLLEPSRASNSNTHIDAHLQTKAMSLSAIQDTSAKSTTKSGEMEKERLRIAVSGEKPRKWKETHETHKQSDSITEGGLNLKEAYEAFDLTRPSFSLGGRRRSFCNSQTELADFFSCNGAKVVSVDMPPFMQVHAVDRARKTYDSLEKFTSKTLAFTLKKEFDKVYGPAWHCIVGTSFGSFVTHSVGGFLYFSMDHKLYILLFKTTVQRAN
ncbi:Dynein ATPase [Bertholletia excelsa]